MKHIKTFESYIASVNEGGLFQSTFSPQQKFSLSVSAIQQKIQDLQSKANDKPEESMYIKAQIDVERQKLDVIKAQIQADKIKTQLANRKEQEKRMKEYEKKNK